MTVSKALAAVAGLVALALGALSGCAGAPSPPGQSAWRHIDVTAAPYQIRGDKKADLAFGIGALTYRGGVHLTSDAGEFGGYSGIAISPDGASLLALSDRSHWLAGNLRYNEVGRLIGLENARISNVTDQDGAVLSGDSADAEAVFGLGADLYVSFERNNRIDVYRPDENGVIEFRNHFASFEDDDIPYNKGIEAIAPLTGGQILAITEGALAPDGGVNGWIIDKGGDRAPLSYLPADKFSPTDAALLANGDLLMVERAYSRVLGARARLTRVSAAQLEAGRALKGEELATFRQPLVVDNMEGLAVRTTDDGRTLIYLISDDNQNVRQKTILLMFELDG